MKDGNSTLIDFNGTPYMGSSKVLAHANRLNWRANVLLGQNKQYFKGKRVLDLASHDGRFSYAALQTGAEYVKGVEGRPESVDKANENMRSLGIPAEKYDFEAGDLVEYLAGVQPGEFDVILCFGVFSHLIYQFEVIKEIKRINPDLFILDTWIIRESFYTNMRTKILNYIINYSIDKVQLGNKGKSRWQYFKGLLGSVKQPSGNIVLLYEDPQAPGSTIDPTGLMAWTTNSALKIMFDYYGFSSEEVNWKDQGITDWRQLGDYKKNKRASWLLTSPGK
ncbi:class I SAM-dependent methyltransferase [Thalassomonas viridans]|uniref:Class I SAM-dependent methyltransferase n=1 Tax=Thalassomonas viridans TaxID=137584 RepID=A0AAE9ZGH5_9GAMM|nr:class I SAM-dependent methyltransferase [Thalassomonas viridans]WDE09257.1 class I SAM-dependent methyltransferase [Thalassomonas viridans]